jgi:hypothetical protein
MRTVASFAIVMAVRDLAAPEGVTYLVDYQNDETVAKLSYEAACQVAKEQKNDPNHAALGVQLLTLVEEYRTHTDEVYKPGDPV